MSFDLIADMTLRICNVMGVGAYLGIAIYSVAYVISQIVDAVR